MKKMKHIKKKIYIYIKKQKNIEYKWKKKRYKKIV